MSKQISLHPVARAIFAQRLPALAALLVPGLAAASPIGGNVVAGQAGITAPGAGATVINQSSQSAIINWQQFNIGGNEYVIFNQPNASAAVLNRVISGGASEILGKLSANGRVFLINPQGVIFGKGAQVDVGGLVATTMNIADRDFMAGRYVFANGTQAPVSNAGVINAASGGFVVLAGDYVNNTGVIQAKLGDVVLASGSAMTLDLAGDGLINLSVDQRALSERAGVSNLGEIAAQGGSVVMTAKVARGLAATAVNNGGVIQAQGIAERGGDIYLTADGGDAVNSGRLDVSGLNGQDAGNIRIHSDHDITLADGSQILATGAGGGDVRIVAENHLDVVYGAYTDVGRLSQTGKAGFAEYSGHQSVAIRDIVHLGDNGALLVDPMDITIGYGGGTTTPGYDQATIERQLQSMAPTATFTIDANSAGTGTGTISVLGDLQGNTLHGRSASPGFGGSLTLNAGSNGSVTFVDQNTVFDINGDLTIHGGSTGGTQKLGNLQSGGSIAIDGLGQINTGYLYAATGIFVNSQGGGVSFTTIKNYNSNGSSPVANTGVDVTINAFGGSISGGGIVVDNSLSATSFASGMDASLNLNAKSDIVLGASGILVKGGGGSGSIGALNIVASGALTAGGTIHVGGAIAITGTDYHFTNPNTGEDIRAGGAGFQAAANAFAADADIRIAGEGLANLDVTGHNGITLSGNTTATASAASITEPNQNGKSLALQYGHATVLLTADDGKSGAIPTMSAVRTGNISATGPNAIIGITGGSVEVGNANNLITDTALSADGASLRQFTQIKDAQGNVLYQSNLGSGQISILTGGANAQGQGILTHGGIVANGPGSEIDLFSTRDVNVGGISATGIGYNVSGDTSLNPLNGPNPTNAGSTPFSFGSDTPFKLKQGAVRWGAAHVFIGSANPVGPQGSAGRVTINGGLTLRGVGKAEANILASQASIGDISIQASQGSLQGTFTSQETINGFLYNVTRVLGDTAAADGSVTGTATYGKANFDLRLSDGTANSQIGKIDARGNSASVSLNGGHDIAVAGDVFVGGFRNTNPQLDTPPPVVAENVSYAPAPAPTTTTTTTTTGPAIASHTERIAGDINAFSAGFEQALTGNLALGTHNITVEGTGVAAAVINAAGIQTGQISITGHTGSLSFQTSGGAATPTIFNDTALLLNATSGTANTGAVSVAGEGNIHLGGKFNAGAGPVSLLATGAFDSQIPGLLLGIDHPLDGGTFPRPTKPPKDLGALDIATTGSILFKFGADSSLTGLSLAAGNGLTVDGDLNKTGSAHGLQAGANPALNGGSGAVGVLNVNVGATGTATIQSIGNTVDVQHSIFGIATGAPAGSMLNVAVGAGKAASVTGSTFNVNGLSLTSNTDNVIVQSGSNLIANTVQLVSNGAGKNVAVSNSFISTNGGVAAGNGDLKVQSAGSFTITNSTLNDLSGGLGLITATGNGTTSSIGSSVLNFSGPLQIAVSGTGSGLSISGGRIGPSTATAVALIAKAATTPGDVSISSSGNLSLNTTINANNLTLTAGDTLSLIGSAAAINSFLSGTNAVIAGAPGFILTTNALGVQSTAGYIDLTNSSISVGTGVTTLGQDPAMLANLGVFKPTALGPNAAFAATGGTNGTVSLGNLTLTGGYLFVRGLSAGFNGKFLPTANSLFYNFVPVHLDAGISIAGIENLVNSYAQTNGPNAVLTLAFGSSQFSGPVFAGSAATPINVSTPANFVFVTTNAVQGYDAIQTKGQVATLNSGVLSIRQAPPPPPPPAVQQQGQNASFAVANNPPPANDPTQNKQIGDVNNVNGTTDNGQGEIENHTHEGVLDQSCI